MEPKFKVGDKVKVCDDCVTTIEEVKKNIHDKYDYYFFDKGKRWFAWEQDIELIQE